MRKIILLLAFIGLSATTMAQDSQWFVQTNFSWNAWYAVGQKSLVAPFHKFPGGGGDGHTGWGLSLSGGRWMTSALALRTKLNMWQMGTKSDDGQKADKYWTLNEQLVFNLSSVLMGHNPYRFWNCMPYIGAGISRNMSAAHYTSNLSFGILNTFRLTPKLAGNFEIGWNSYEGNGGIALKDRLQQITFEFGVTWCFGTSKAKKKAEADAMESLSEGEIDALNAQLSDLEAENEQLRKELEEAKKVKNEK